MATKADYRAAWALISDPAHWTQYGFARGVNGESCSPKHRLAARWCALGAMARVGVRMPQIGELEVAAAEQHGALVTGVNDGLGHEAVRQMFARAIELAPE